MHRGQIVEVQEAFDGKGLKAVVDWDDKFVYVCREQEFKSAQRENREPMSIGFAHEFVREVDK